MESAFLIAGPTASGKSALALEIARRTGGVVVNADSMQVYSQLFIVTARPGPAEEAAATHRLYGHVDARRPYSTGEWLRDVEGLIAGSTFEAGPAIFVGGTGLYFKALTEGMSTMPEVPPSVRSKWRGRLAVDGPAALHEALAEGDATAAAAIAPSDGQRVVRALEVLEASGRSITQWHSARARPLVDAETACKVVLEPERDFLHRRIAARFDTMVSKGALPEVEALLGLGLDPAMPAMKAIGVRELADVLGGRSSLEEAGARAVVATRRYAKRQMTWFRHQTGPDWRKMMPDDRLSMTEQARMLLQRKI